MYTCAFMAHCFLQVENKCSVYITYWYLYNVRCVPVSSRWTNIHNYVFTVKYSFMLSHDTGILHFYYYEKLRVNVVQILNLWFCETISMYSHVMIIYIYIYWIYFCKKTSLLHFKRYQIEWFCFAEDRFGFDCELRALERVHAMAKAMLIYLYIIYTVPHSVVTQSPYVMSVNYYVIIFVGVTL